MEAEGFTIRKLEEGIQYWFKVQAIYEEFSGPWSEKAEGTTGQPEPPTDFKIIKKPTKDGKRSLALRWKKNEVNEDLEIRYSYKVKCNETGGVAKEKEASQEEVSMKMNELALKAGKEYICELYIETDKGVRSTVERRSTTAKAIEAPAFSQTSVQWGTDITFGMLEGHKYRLKDSKGGVVSLDISNNPARISATESVSAVVIEVTHTEYEGKEESAEIAFTRQAGDRFKFKSASHDFMFNTNENKYTHVITETDPEDTPVRYSINPSSSGARIDGSSGEVRITAAAVGNTFTITATKAADDKYAEEREEYELRVKASTNTGDIVKPTFRPSKSVSWGTRITFAKEAEHTYTLKDEKGGVVSLRAQGSSMAIDATQAVSAVVVVARRTGYAGSIESDPIEFTKQAGNTLRFANANENTMYDTGGNTYKQTATNDGSVSDDNRNIEYSISPTGQGASVNPVSGQVSLTAGAAGRQFKITAKKAADEKYRKQSATYELRVTKNTDTSAIKMPEFSSKAVPWKEADITFTKAGADYRYELKQGYIGVSLEESDTSIKIKSTKEVRNVIIVVTRLGYGSVESEAIAFLNYKYYPQTRDELAQAIKAEVLAQGKDGKENWEANLNNIDTSAITNMELLFSISFGTGHPDYELYEFNGDISAWNVSVVQDMSNMFRGAAKFNQDISNWKVGAVEDMSFIFGGAAKFNQDISGWDVKKVTSMASMFSGATAFNQDISNWKVGAVESMSFMFHDATAFNQDISNWNVSAVQDMKYMFHRATSFKQDLDAWGKKIKNVIKANWENRVQNMFYKSGMTASLPAWCVERCKQYSSP